jgi:gliding motility-associated-like protein
MNKTRATLYTILILFLSVIPLKAQQGIQITSVVTTPVSCFGYSDGTVSVEVTGGSGIYNYLLLRLPDILVGSSGLITDQNFTFSNLEKHLYLVLVVGEDTTEEDPGLTYANVSGPNLLKINSAVAANISCNNVNDGRINVSATGESGSYIFDLTGPQSGTTTDGIFGNLTEGTYTVTVNDASGCPSSDVTGPLTILNPPPLSVSVDNVTNVECYGEQTGSIAITPSGGTPGGGGTGYTYAWTGPGFTSSSEDLINIGAGDYLVTVSDANSCAVNEGPVNITQPAEIVMTVDNITHVPCFGGSEGAISVTISGGTPGYTFEWNGPFGIIYPSEDLSGLAAGSYQLTVTDAAGCVQVMEPVMVSQPSEIVVSADPSDISCFGLGDGRIDLTVSGGNGTYTFEWTGPGGFNAPDQNITGLQAGTYNLTVTDGNGCIVDLPGIATINEPEAISVTSIRSDISCNGLDDGAITLTLTGGTPAYLFSWTGPGGFISSDQDISLLGPGIYSLNVADGNGCTASFPGLDTIIDPAPITASLVLAQDPHCNGGNDGLIQIDVSGGTPPYSFNWKNSAGITVSTDEDPTGLPAGSYWGTITDVNGCTFTSGHYIILNNPAPIVSTYTTGDVSCFGGSDGSVSVTSSGGTSPYEYSIQGDIDSTYQSDPTFSLLSAGTHSIWTRDDNLCVIRGEVTLLQPESMVISSESVSGSILCYGDSTLQISIGEVTGGTGPYTYSINGGADFYPSPDFDNLSAGDYQTVVRDSRGCTVSGSLHQLTQPLPLIIDDIQLQDVSSCYDGADGSILVSAEGGSGILTFTLNGGSPNTTGNFTGLMHGFYLVSVSDENGCSLDSTVAISAPDSILVSSLTVTPVTGCYGDATGSIKISGSGGTPPFRYSMDGVNFNASGNFNGITGGAYTLTIRDNSGCTLDTLVTVTQPAPITIVSGEATQVTCAGAADGIITIVAAGGTPPLEYTLMPDGTTNNTGIFTGLSPAIYTALVNDAEGCGPIASAGIFITEPPALLIDSVIDQQITCNGAGDGMITLYGSGGIPPYQYSVDDQSTWGEDSLFIDLTPGTYEVFIRDSNLCVTYGGSVTMNDPPALTLAVTTTDVTTCSYDSTGAIEATGSGGSGTLSYSLDGLNFQPTGSFTQLPAGTYTVTLSDETGCTTTQETAIQAPEAISATIFKTDAIQGNPGSITISEVSGGFPPYEFTINGPLGPFTTDTVYSDLAIGSYQVMVRDLVGCIYEEMVEIVDVPPLEVTVTVNDVSCFGAGDGSIEMVPANAFGTVEYSIDSGMNYVNVSLFEGLQGNTTYYLLARDEEGKLFTGSAFVNEPEEILLTSNIIPAECNAFSETGGISLSVSGGTGGFTYLWSDGSTQEDRPGMAAGTYALETTDSNGCVRRDTFTVGSQIIVVAYAGEDTTICYGATIQLDGQGNHTPSWDPSPFLSDPTIADPLAGPITEETVFVLTITEETSPFGCYDVDSIHISLYPNSGIQVTSDTVILSGSSLQLEVSGGPFNAYRWEPSNWLDNSTVPDPIATPEEAIRYRVFATNEYGCEEMDSVFIDVIEDLKVYNVFSPNGDGVNDYFEIDHAENFPEMRVEIYSRWGDLLYSTVGYDSGSKWDGNARGTEAPVGTYYYVIIPYSGAKPMTGNVTIIR